MLKEDEQYAVRNVIMLVAMSIISKREKRQEDDWEGRGKRFQR